MGSKIIKEIYLYRQLTDCNLPKHGWLQPCYNCDVITSHTIFLCKLYEKKTKYVCYAYLCKSCNRVYKKKIIINKKRLTNELVKNNKLNPIKIDYTPVEPCPPLPLCVSSNVTTI